MTTAILAHKATILIIEDNLQSLEQSSEILDSAGFQTFQAEDVVSGMKLARETLPDLILVDIHLSYQEEVSAIEAIKSDPQLKDIPILAFTALAMSEEQKKALTDGCIEVINKPIEVNQFTQIIEKCLKKLGKHPEADLSKLKPPVQEMEINGSTPAWQKNAIFHPRDTLTRFSNAPLPTGRYSYPLVEAGMEDKIQPADISQHTVMVVDDNPLNVELLKDALESMGQEVIPAYSGPEALKLVENYMPDLILLDIMMPDMDGYTVLNFLKKDSKTKDIPVIFISALNKTQDMVRGFKQGTYDYITKPFKIEEVKARIMASLRIKDLQDNLRSERDKLDSIFKYSADGIVLLDPHFQIITANPKFAEWFGIPLGPDGNPASRYNFYQMIGCQCQNTNGEICPLHQDNVRLAIDTELSSEISEEQANICLMREVSIPSEAGSPRYLSIHGGMIKSTSNKLQGYVVVLWDITQEKLIQKSKENFVATLTHDLKTPIRAEYQALNLLQTGSFGSLAPEQQDVLKEILQSNRYMSQLVDSLLTTYMYEEGKLELKLEPLALNGLIRNQVIPSLKLLADEKRQHIELHLANELPMVNVDPVQMQRVLNNLLQNAVNYSPENANITISTYSKDNLVYVSVQDQGPGIDSESLKFLFDRYKTFGKKFQKVGTGLGLYLSKKIIEALHGEIFVESEVGKGSHFYFSLPQA